MHCACEDNFQVRGLGRDTRDIERVAPCSHGVNRGGVREFRFIGGMERGANAGRFTCHVRRKGRDNFNRGVGGGANENRRDKSFTGERRGGINHGAGDLIGRRDNFDDAGMHDNVLVRR